MFKQIAQVLSPEFEGKKVAIRGWVYRCRKFKDKIFLVIRDSSDIIQAVITKDSSAWEDARRITIESSCELEGVVKKDKRAPTGYELHVEKLRIVGLAQTPFPISRDVSREFLLDIRHISVRQRRLQQVWKIRSKVFESIREFLLKRGFFESHGPYFTRTSESGLELFQVDYFGEKVRLSQTQQFYLEALLPVLERVFTIGPSFRAEKSKTARHLTEYWHAELEVAWCDLDCIVKIAEELVAHVCQKVAKDCAKELKILGRDPEKLKKIKPPFPRITYRQALEILKKDGLEVPFGKDLRTIEEKQLMRHYDKPLIITHYPKAAMAFYKPRDPKDPEVALCFDMLAPETGFELIGGSVRDLDIEEMKKALIERGEDPKDYEWYFDTRRYGAVPHAGFGLGVERLIMWICGLDTIKDAIPFPRTPERCEP